MQMHFDFCIGRKARVEFVLACVFVVIAIVQAEVEFFRRKRAAEADVDDARVMANSGWVNVANGGDAFVRNRTEDRFSDVPHSLSAGRAIEQADQMFIKVLVGPITGICYPVDEDVNLSFVWVRWCLLNRCKHPIGSFLPKIVEKKWRCVSSAIFVSWPDFFGQGNSMAAKAQHQSLLPSRD